MRNKVKMVVPVHFYGVSGMFGKLEKIEGIVVSGTSYPSIDDQGRGAGRLEVRDHMLERIRTIAGKDSIRRFSPVQAQGDHKTQDIVFTVDDTDYCATLRYNNAMTEGRIEDLRKQVKKC
jgi:hypothetical protein